MTTQLSPIQDEILYRLKYATHLRYRDLHAKPIPNDLFNYHLQHLVKKGFVKKTSQGYSLSDVGTKHVADPISVPGPAADLFKINIITVLSRVHKGRIEILNQRRTSNPSFGKIGAPGGVVRKGESIETAAGRKLEQETGLHATFKHIGCERRIMYRSGELFSDVIFPIAYADSCSGELEADTKFGFNLWVPISQAIKNESGDFDSIQSIVHVLKAVKKGSIQKLPFFFNETTQHGI